VELGETLTSILSGRRYVEAMVHDRWTIDPQYQFPPTMALTLEGTYHFSPRADCCSTEEDYMTLGVEMGLTIFDYVQAMMEKYSNH